MELNELGPFQGGNKLVFKVTATLLKFQIQKKGKSSHLPLNYSVLCNFTLNFNVGPILCSLLAKVCINNLPLMELY